MARPKYYTYYVTITYEDANERNCKTQHTMVATDYHNLIHQTLAKYDELGGVKLRGIYLSRHVIPQNKQERKKWMNKAKREKQARETWIYDGLTKIKKGLDEDD